MILKNFYLKIKPIFDKKGLNDNPKNLIANINKLKNLGFSPKKNFNVGIKQYINWYKEKNL